VKPRVSGAKRRATLGGSWRAAPPWADRGAPRHPGRMWGCRITLGGLCAPHRPRDRIRHGLAEPLRVDETGTMEPGEWYRMGDTGQAWASPRGLLLVVSLHPIFHQKPPVLFPEGLGLMVLFLMGDVDEERRKMGWTDREGAVAVLPLKLGQGGVAGLEPPGGLAFQLTEKIGESDGSRETTGDVNMVLHAPDPQGRAAEILASARQIGMGGGTEVRIAQSREATLGGEDEV